jgi:hypothetical protein
MIWCFGCRPEIVFSRRCAADETHATKNDGLLHCPVISAQTTSLEGYGAIGGAPVFRVRITTRKRERIAISNQIPVGTGRILFPVRHCP